MSTFRYKHKECPTSMPHKYYLLSVVWLLPKSVWSSGLNRTLSFDLSIDFRVIIKPKIDNDSLCILAALHGLPRRRIIFIFQLISQLFHTVDRKSNFSFFSPTHRYIVGNTSRISTWNYSSFAIMISTSCVDFTSKQRLLFHMAYKKTELLFLSYYICWKSSSFCNSWIIIASPQ